MLGGYLENLDIKPKYQIWILDSTLDICQMS